MTGLQKQSVSISLAQGLDTKTDPKQVVPGRLVQLENGVFISPQKITKRNGYLRVGQAGVEGYGMASFEDELLCFDSSTLRSYAESLEGFKSKGGAVSLEVSSDAVISNASGQTSQDGCYHSAGLKCFVWEDTRGGVRYTVTDEQTKQQVVADAVLDSSGARPKAFPLGNYVLMVYVDGANLCYKRFGINAPETLSSKVFVATNVQSGTPNWDGVIVGDRLFLVWYSSASTNSVSSVYINKALTVSTALDVTGEIASGGITAWAESYEFQSEAATTSVGDSMLIMGLGDPETQDDTTTHLVWVAYYNGTKVRSYVLTYDNALSVSAFDVETVSNVRNLCGITTSRPSVTVSQPVSRLLYEITNATTYNYNVRHVTLTRTSLTAVTVGTPAVFLRSVGLGFKPFTYNGSHYVGLAYQSTLQPTYFIANLDKAIVAKISAGTGGGLPAKAILPTTWSVSDSEFMVAILEKSRVDVQSGTVFTLTGVSDVGVSFLSLNTFLRATMAHNLHITGGVLSMYDGVSVVEHGFHVFPEQAAAPTPGATGGSMSDGTYSYCFVYAWTDNKGNVHRSAPSVAQQVTLSGGGSAQKVTWALPTLRLTAKRALFNRAECVIDVYRTVTTGTVYYKVTSIASPTLNDPTADTVSFIDTLADSTIIGNELLYTLGGVVENVSVPACSLISTYKSRLVIVPSEDKLTFWVSKQGGPGAPVEWSDFFIKQIDARDGDITAIAQMDEKLVIFKRNSVWMTAGDGPNDTGTSDDMQTPQLITTDAGCKNPRSVVVTPVGLMRQSEKGIYLITRSLEDVYIGAEVESYNDLEITSAQLVPNTNQVRFTTESGTCLVYDYFFKQWSTFSNHRAVDSTIWQDRFVYLNPEGVAYKENLGNSLDDGFFQPLKIKTGWLSFGGLQGFQRVYQLLFLGDYKSPHRMICTTAVDFNANPVQQTYINAGSLLQNTTYGEDSPYGSGSPYGGDDPLYQFRVFMAKQKCQAIQIGLEEVQDSDYGEGLSLSALNFLVGVKSGTYKVPPTRSFG